MITAPSRGNGKLHIWPRAVASTFTLGSDVGECVSESVIVRRRLNVTLIVRTVVYSQKHSTFVDISCPMSGNSGIVRSDRIFCVIHRELATSRRRFELSTNLHRRGWIRRWLLIDDGWSQRNWWDYAWTFLNNNLTYAVFFQVVNLLDAR